MECGRVEAQLSCVEEPPLSRSLWIRTDTMVGYGGIQCEYDGILWWDMVGYRGIQCEYDGILWWDTRPCVRGSSGGHLYTPSPLSPRTLQHGVDHIGRLHRGLRPVTRPTVMGRRLNRELARCGSLCHTAASVWRRCHTSTLPRCGTGSCATLQQLRMTKVSHLHTTQVWN